MALILTLFLALVSFGHCALLGSEKCTYGPSYWCSHLHHAKECGAIQHCMSTVWAKNQPAMTGTTETCFDVVNSLNVVRSSNEAKFLDHMAMACTGLSGDKRSKCKELVKNDQEELLMLLRSDLSSPAIATALGLCGGFEDTVPHPGQQMEFRVTGDYCTDCVNFFSDVREILNNTEGQAEAAIKSLICPRLGSLEDLCNQLIDQYAAIVFNMLYQQLNPKDICFMLQMCTNSTRVMVSEKLRETVQKVRASNLTCELCKDMAHSVQEALRDQTLQTQIESDIENMICPLLPGSMAQQCKAYVAAYAPLAFQMIVAEMDPSSFCQMLGLCKYQTESRQTHIIRLGMGSSNTNVRVAPPVRPKENLEALPTCALCEFVMAKLDQMLGDNATEEEITAALDKVCSLLPDTLSGECKSFVDAYAPMIIKLLVQEVAPKVICSALGLCPGAQPQPQVNTVLPTGNGVECDICETVIQLVNKEVANNTKSIEQALKEVCDKLPASYRSLCKALVDEYTPALINILNQYDDPHKVCTDIGMCTAKAHLNSGKTQGGFPLQFVPMTEIKPSHDGLVGSRKCTFGPSFWCASRENARLCNIPLQHCAEKYGMKLDDKA